jgi:hypothetical protein
MLVPFARKSRISCRFLHGPKVKMRLGAQEFAHFETSCWARSSPEDRLKIAPFALT